MLSQLAPPPPISISLTHTWSCDSLLFSFLLHAMPSPFGITVTAVITWRMFSTSMLSTSYRCPLPSKES